MRVSLSQIRKITDIKLPEITELVDRINRQLGGVEEVFDLGQKYKGAVIVRVVECNKHPNADKLSVCLIDDNQVLEGVERDEDGLVRVVCGAPNVHGGMLAVWLPPGSTVPSSCDDDQPFVLSARELRGVISNGMLASAKELSIGDDHDGIVEITKDDVEPSLLLELDGKIDKLIGRAFSEVFGLDSYAIDIENKMFTHRPDLFGQIGVAREISAIIGGVTNADEGFVDTRYQNPEWYWQAPTFDEAKGLELSVSNDASDRSPRFMAVAMQGIEVRPSPLWLKCELVAMGAKPINNIVDVTNYVMLMTAQPTHAYDYDKLSGHKLGVRLAKNGEEISLINHKSYKLCDEDLVIVDGAGPVGLAGVMGGVDTEVSDETKNIVLEVGSFDMYSVRKTSMKYGIFTDALTRFNKGQSPLQSDRVIWFLLDIISTTFGAKQASPVYDISQIDWKREVAIHTEVRVGADFVNSRLGSSLTVSQIDNLLRRVNFASYPVEDDENTLVITAPFWRTDIELAEDIVEEVGRLCGYDSLPRRLPNRSTKPVTKNKTTIVKQAIRQALKRAGANELLTYSFVNQTIFDKSGQDVEQAFKISNALSPDLKYYRLSVLPSLLDKVHPNIKAGHDEFMLYEIGKGHNKKQYTDDDGNLPSEMSFVDLVYASKNEREGAPYYHARKIIDFVSRELGFSVKYRLVDESFGDDPVMAPFDTKRSSIVESADGIFIGVVGELRKTVINRFKLPEYCSAVTLSLENVIEASDLERSGYRPLSKFPKISQDISIKTTSTMDYQRVHQLIDQLVTSQGEFEIMTRPVSIYMANGDDSAKTMTFHLDFVSQKKTLVQADIAPFIEKLQALLVKEINAIIE